MGLHKIGSVLLDEHCKTLLLSVLLDNLHIGLPNDLLVEFNKIAIKWHFLKTFLGDFNVFGAVVNVVIFWRSMAPDPHPNPGF